MTDGSFAPVDGGNSQNTKTVEIAVIGKKTRCPKAKEESIFVRRAGIVDGQGPGINPVNRNFECAIAGQPCRVADRIGDPVDEAFAQRQMEE